MFEVKTETQNPAPKSDAHSRSQFNIYIFRKDHAKNRLPYWEKINTTNNQKRAINYAHLLYKTDKFEKVEVKKHSFSEYEHKLIEQTVCTYQKLDYSWLNITNLFT